MATVAGLTLAAVLIVAGAVILGGLGGGLLTVGIILGLVIVDLARGEE